MVCAALWPFAASGADGGASAAVVGGAKLLGVFGEAKDRMDRDFAKVLRRQMARIRARWDDVVETEDWAQAADLAAADERLAKHLADSIPSAKELGGTIRGGKPYPQEAALLIVAELAKRDDCAIFRAEGGWAPAQPPAALPSK
jgi:hypothetical protein